MSRPMIVIAEILAAALIAVLTVCLRQARELAEQRRMIEQLETKVLRLQPPPEIQSGTKPRARMMGALYAEKSGLLDELGSLPGAPLMGLAGALAIIALVFGLTLGRPSSAGEGPARSDIAGLHHGLDSVSAVVAKLSDSLRAMKPAVVAGTARPAVATQPRTQKAAAPVSHPTALAPSPQIPSAPVFEAAQSPAKP